MLTSNLSFKVCFCLLIWWLHYKLSPSFGLIFLGCCWQSSRYVFYFKFKKKQTNSNYIDIKIQTINDNIGQVAKCKWVKYLFLDTRQVSTVLLMRMRFSRIPDCERLSSLSYPATSNTSNLLEILTLSYKIHIKLLHSIKAFVALLYL